MKERGGKIEPPIAYEEVADHRNISAELRNKLTSGGGRTGHKENAWRSHIGCARDDSVKQGIIAPMGESGRGLWRLTGKEFHDPMTSSWTKMSLLSKIFERAAADFQATPSRA